MGRYQTSSAACAVLFVVVELAQLCLCANSSIPSPCVERERQALLEFKASLHDPSNLLSSWQGVHCCQWEGIGCDNLTGHVVKLDLTTPYMKCRRSAGPYVDFSLRECDYGDEYVEAANVNPSLLQLEYLTHLDLSGNSFNHSPIPVFIGSMQRLTYLSLSGADFGGRIPSSLGNLTNLHFLDLSWNYDLQTSDANWISGLRSLEYLDMSGVDLGRALKLFQVNLTNAPRLQALLLAGSGLTVLDALRNMTSLVHLDLSWNNLTSVPSWFGKFKKLEYLDLLDCGLYGPIPDAFQNLTSIQSLYLFGNNFDFVPSWFHKFEKLKHLDLSFNKFRGPLPDAIRNMTSIEFLDLSQNNFTSIPSWFAELNTLLYLDLSSNEVSSMECSLLSILRSMCRLKSFDLSRNKVGEKSIGRNELSACIRHDLEKMDLSYNKFSDYLPSWLEQLENLRYLYLEKNLFYGPIPFSFKKLSKLKILYLSNNKLGGVVPNSMGQLINLTYLDILNNCFNGTIPQSFGQLVNLNELDMSSNNLGGTITLGKNWSLIMPQLWYLNLSNNQISGSLPRHIGHIMPDLGQLLLGNNLINGSVPNSLCQTGLWNLDLSKNKLVGEIPNCWKDDGGWAEINLSSNKLSGVFPSSFGNLSSLSWLHLNDNNLQGELPMFARHLKLLILDVGDNKLSGIIPSWTANTFPSLQILRLRQNMLTGSIPSQLCHLSSLKILDLSHNNLQGSIPWCIGNLRGMILDKPSSKSTGKRVHLSDYNRVDASLVPDWSREDVKEVMKGREFDYIDILELVVMMDLSKNNLVGSIPKGITLLNGLHSLNLSNNHLIGEIPKMIGNMKSLESFDVSNNQLSGTIPNSMSALTSLSDLNLAHNNFSGPIPTDNQFLTYGPSSYADNPYLCGFPLPNECFDDKSHQIPGNRGFEDEDDKTDELEKWLFYLVVTAGFAIGFWGVIGTLLFKKSWRHAYFRWVQDAADRFYVAIAIKVAKLKKQMSKTLGSAGA